MKIGNLNQHCVACAVIGFCGNGWGYCLCADTRFSEINEDDYIRIAETSQKLKEYASCTGCTRPDCDAYRYSETDFENEACEYNDDSIDFKCEQVADYVHKKLKEATHG